MVSIFTPSSHFALFDTLHRKPLYQRLFILVAITEWLMLCVNHSFSFNSLENHKDSDNY